MIAGMVLLQPQQNEFSQSNEDATSFTSGATTNSNTSTTQRRSSIISFGTIEIREYNRVLIGDYVDVSHALAIGWEYEQHPPISLLHDEKGDENEPEPILESERPPLLVTGRRQSSLLWVNHQTPPPPPLMQGVATPICCERRKRILHEFGYSKKELAQAEQERRRTLKGKPPKKYNKIGTDHVGDGTSLPLRFIPIRFFRIPSRKSLDRVCAPPEVAMQQSSE